MTDDERQAVSKSRVMSGLLVGWTQESSVPLPCSQLGKCSMLPLSSGATSTEEEGAGSPEVPAPLPTVPLLKAPSPAGPFLFLFSQVHQEPVLRKVYVFMMVSPH